MTGTSEQKIHQNRHFADVYEYSGNHLIPTTIRLTSFNSQGVYSADVPPETVSFRALTKPDCINWFKVEGLMNAPTITRLLEEMGFQNQDAREILTPAHVVKIDNSGSHILIILNNCTFQSSRQIYSEHVCLVATGNTIISFTETHERLFEHVAEAIEANVMNIRGQQSGLLLAFLLNSVIADLIDSAVKVEKMLEKMEDTLLNRQYNYKSVGRKLQGCRHAHMIIRKNTEPLKKEFHKLVRPTDYIIDEKLVPIFDDLSDQLEYIIQTSCNSTELLSSLVDLYGSNNDLRANFIMQRLTVVSTLFIPITFLVGVWGMNFQYMPELALRYGYPISWLIILATAAGSWYYMKKKNWF
ncbi:MAG: magnesium and cobalt transport protein CorA [Tannerellaceae bacterium]|nr:magnesium and cobalt transport protein CorA [Tannerellaceae bacterium]